MAQKLKPKSMSGTAFQKLERDLQSGTPGNAYIFYGEEVFLREQAIQKLKKILIPKGLDAFNFHALDGQDLTMQTLSETVEALPMMAERTLIRITDFDLFKPDKNRWKFLIDFLSDLPSHCCLVFVYDTIAYQTSQANQTNSGAGQKKGEEKKQEDNLRKELRAAIADYTEVIEFRPLNNPELIGWIQKRFQNYQKSIDTQTADYLIFFCGNFMTDLSQEIDKIAMYSQDTKITRQVINEIAIPVLSASIFQMTDAMITNRNFKQAARILGELLSMQTEPIQIVAALGKQLRKLYTACIALETGSSSSSNSDSEHIKWLQKLWKMKSEYPASLLIKTAHKTSRKWCAQAIRLCQILDQRMKSETGIDKAGELKRLLVLLYAEQRRTHEKTNSRGSGRRRPVR